MTVSLRRIKEGGLFIGGTLLAGGIGAWLGGDFSVVSALNAPPLAPPSWLFFPVWTVLYILMGYAAYTVWRQTRTFAVPALRLYAAQLAVNLLWPLFFFRLQWRLFAFLWLLALIALIWLTARATRAYSVTAARLYLPYLLWCGFAAYLNLGYSVLN